MYKLNLKYLEVNFNKEVKLGVTKGALVLYNPSNPKLNKARFDGFIQGLCPVKSAEQLEEILKELNYFDIKTIQENQYLERNYQGRKYCMRQKDVYARLNKTFNGLDEKFKFYGE